MVAKFSRTVAHTTALVKVIDKANYTVFEREIPLAEYVEDKDKALKACQKILYAENPNVVILDLITLEHEKAKYTMTLDTFLKYATKED